MRVPSRRYRTRYTKLRWSRSDDNVSAVSDARPNRAPAPPDPRLAAKLREQLVTDLRRAGELRGEAVAGALGEVPREAFVSEIAAKQGVEAVYRNAPLPVKVDARGRWLSSSSQPSMMALMLEQLELTPGQRVLEIGAGTGYNAALLRHLVGSAGRVTTVEIDSALARKARSALRASGYAVRVVHGDGRVGFPPGAPYDRIIVTASAKEIPNAWLAQLRSGGRLVLPLQLALYPVPQVIPALERRDGMLRSVAMTWGWFMPLHGGDGGQRGPPDNLCASVQLGGEHSELMRISGPGLTRRSDSGRRALLALVLREPRMRTLRGHIANHWPAPPGLLLHLSSCLPAARRIELRSPRRWAIGLVSETGAALVVASMPARQSGRADSPDMLRQPKRKPWWVESYGDPSLAGELEDEIDEILAGWHALTSSGRTQLQIHARQSSASSIAELTLGWTEPEIVVSS